MMLHIWPYSEGIVYFIIIFYLYLFFYLLLYFSVATISGELKIVTLQCDRTSFCDYSDYNATFEAHSLRIVFAANIPQFRTSIVTRSSAIAGRPCDAKACQGSLK